MEEARKRAIFREMDANPGIFIMGGDPSRRASPEYMKRYSDRMLDPPLSEFAYSSVAVGAAMAGMRLIVSVHTSSFIFYGWPALVVEAANIRYASNGLVTAPVVFSIIAGSRRGGGPQHQHTPHAMLQNIPGIRILAPSTAREVDSVIHSALTSSDPTVIVDHTLLNTEGDVPDDPQPLASVYELAGGTDVAIVTYSYMSKVALDAALELNREGISVGVFSVPVLAPSPVASIAEKVSGYKSVLFVDESVPAGSPASYWMANCAQTLPGINVAMLCSKPVPGPAAPHLCDAVIPSVTEIAGEVRRLIARRD